MTEHEFTLADRIAKIKAINEQYDLENNAFLSFSGGKDSTVLHHLIDESLPGNRIPRVFFNTGIEYKLIVKFVKELAANDNRFVLYTVGKDIKKTLYTYGFPFKSKEHSQKLYEWKNGARSKYHRMYFRELEGGYQQCPYALMYQKDTDLGFTISHKCCIEFKKKPSMDYQRQSGRKITLTGMLKEEGGQRAGISCTVFDKSSGKLKKFHPLAPVTHNWESWYINRNRIKLAELYYPPYNFNRSGCVCCPFSLDLQSQLDTLSIIAPEEKKRAEYIWEKVYSEYRRIGYRLRKEDNQPTLFD